MENTSFKIFILSLFVSLLIVAGVFVYSMQEKDEKIAVKYVDNPIMFFTVENCVNKYIGLIAAQDEEALYNVIDDTYKKENDITIYNVLDVNVYLNGQYSFVSGVMLEDKNEKNKYYVRGHLVQESFAEDIYDDSIMELEYGIIVKLDIENNTYSVILSEVGEYFDAI